MKIKHWLVSVIAGSAIGAQASCPSLHEVADYLGDFILAQPSKGFGKAISLEEAGCARERLTDVLPAVLGPRVGYKALFTNEESQRRFGVKGPAWGVMFGKMMLANGARLPARFGAKSRYEADFVVIVKDAGLAEAKTPLEAMKHISALVPFVELPDLMLEGTPTGAELIATNAAFRGGVVGTRIPVEPGNAAALLDSLAKMDVVATEDRSGKEVARAKGDVLMANPINAAMWLASALKQEGIRLKQGDMLSLGGFIASKPTQAGTSMTIRYRGLPGDPAVTVHFD